MNAAWPYTLCFNAVIMTRRCHPAAELTSGRLLAAHSHGAHSLTLVCSPCKTPPAATLSPREKWWSIKYGIAYDAAYFFAIAKNNQIEVTAMLHESENCVSLCGIPSINTSCQPPRVCQENTPLTCSVSGFPSKSRLLARGMSRA